MGDLNSTNQKLPLQEAGGLNIRVAVKTDCPRLMELVNELALFERAPEEVTVSLEEFEEAGFGPKPVWKAFVVETDNVIVGFAVYYVRYSTWKGNRLYLEDLIVTEEYRGKGIGKLLFDRLFQEVRELGFSGMVWQVLDWNEPAIKFYEKYGANIEAGWLNASLSKEQIANLYLMKITSIMLLAALALGSCKFGTGPNIDKDAIFRDTVAYTYQTIHERAADCGSKPDSTCTVVDIKYPVFKGKPVLNDTIEHKLLNVFMLGEKPDTSLKAMTANFLKSYTDSKKDDPRSEMFYTLESYAKVIGQDSALIALEYGGYAFQGGAHGGSFTGFINWDGKKNKNVTLDDILIAGYKSELTKIAERIFRKDEKLTPTAPLDDYFFDKNIFKLNENYSITPLGLRFMYNQYEIKPYAAGQTELLIPYSEITKLMRPQSVASQYLHKNAGI